MEATATLNKICQEVGVCEAREGEVHSSSSKFVWIRMGDVAEYESFNTPHDAGVAVGERIIGALEIHPGEHIALSFGYRAAGVSIKPAGISVGPYYVGRNYISLFWGDKDAQWIRDLSHAEQSEFEQGVRAQIP